MQLKRKEEQGTLAFFTDHHPPADTFLGDVLEGLAREPKSLPPKYFYDRRGSELFDRICETAEYYPTRTERALLAEIGPDIAARTGPGAAVIEYGSGSSIKIRTLLDALSDPAAYLALDISRDHLLAAAEDLAADYPHVAVGAICADFTKPLELPECQLGGGSRRLGFLPGSTIGNFRPAEARGFLANMAAALGEGAALLIGVDLKKDPARLTAAYNDAAGVTAAFNLNLLERMRRELGADLDPAAFAHHAFYNDAEGRVEMHLRSRTRQHIAVGGKRFDFAPGETIHTENSYKYTIEEFQNLAESGGFRPAHAWTDPENLFSLHYLDVA